MGSSKAKARVPVSKRALIQRLNRRLAKEGRHGQMLKANRSERWRDQLGDYYVVDLDTTRIEVTNVNLEEWGRELGVLQPYERLEEDLVKGGAT